MTDTRAERPQEAAREEEVPVEEIEPADGEELDEEEDLDSFDDDDGVFDPMHQLTQLFVTEAGTPIVDVLQGISEALDKQNKILYKLVSVVESKHCGK